MIKERKLRREVGIDFSKTEKLTKDSFKEECDVNNILAKYQRTNQIDHINSIQGIFGDFSNASDYQSSLNAVMDANDRFQGLPAHLREKFNNDPAQLLQFVSDDKNYDAAVELGLMDEQKSNAWREKKIQHQALAQKIVDDKKAKPKTDPA